MDYAEIAEKLDKFVDDVTVVPSSGAPDPDVRARAMAALTLARMLSPEWTSIVIKRDAKGKPVLDAQGHVVRETVKKPAGKLTGDRAALEARLAALLGGLSL